MSVHRAVLALIIAVYLAMAASSASTLLPGCDEAWFTLPGHDLVTNGRFGTPVLDESARFRQVRLDGINQRTYWIMPAYPLLQGLAGKAFGFGLMTTRSVSVFFGLIAILGIYLFVSGLSGDRSLGLLAAALVAADQFFLFAAGFGRMDMMTFALGISAIGIFVWLRERKFTLAVLVSFSLAAAAFFAHPLGMMWAVSLALLVLYLDIRRLRVLHLALAAGPFAIMSAAWGSYVARDPALFATQFGGNASDRWTFFSSPINELWREVAVRYLANFGLVEHLNAITILKLLPLAMFLAAIVFSLSIRPLRSQTFVRIALVLAAQQFAMIMLLDSMKQAYYLLHIVPTMIIITAASAKWAFGKGRSFRFAAVAACIALMGVNVLTSVTRYQRDQLGRNFLPAAAVIDRELHDDETVFASAEFWFALPRRDRIVDDYRLGVTTGRIADLIVIDEPRYRDWINALAVSEPQSHDAILKMLQEDYVSLYGNDQYEVLRRKQ